MTGYHDGKSHRGDMPHLSKLLVVRSHSSGRATAVSSTQHQDNASVPQHHQTSKDTVTVYFVDSDVMIEAPAGANIYQVAQDAGVESIQLGCGLGNCGICEVEVKKIPRKRGTAEEEIGEEEEETTGIMVRSCVTPLPPATDDAYSRIEISELGIDAIWGQDGFDM